MKKLKRFWRRIILKTQIEFWKKPTEYFLLIAVMAANYFKYQTPNHNHLFDRIPADSGDFYYRYFDYVEPYTGHK